MPSDPQPNPGRRLARSNWAFAVFLLGFMILLIGVCYYFLYPAYLARRHATPVERARLRAWAALILALLLITLGCGLMLTFRIGRFFFPRPTQPRTRTPYVDIWTEAGKRLQPPGEEEEDGE
jgi:hypothetical protein